MTSKFHIAMYVPGMPFNGESPYESSLGGSETAGWALARELGKRGHTVRMFCNLPDGKPGKWDGVQYLRLDMAAGFFYNHPHDVAIIQRDPGFLQARMSSSINVLWCHDLALARQSSGFRSVTWNVDAIGVVSEYMKQQYRKVYDLPEEFHAVLRNGIDPTDRPGYFDKVPAEKWKRNRKHLVFAARPERGLDNLIERILPALFVQFPDLKVSLFGYNNPIEHLQDFYADLAQKSAQFGDRVVFEGMLSKKDLYSHYVKAGIYAYPTPSPILPEFNEVSCISLMEAQMCGMPVVTSNRGALPETLLPGAGTLIDGDPTTLEYSKQFVDAVASYINEPDKYLAASSAGRAAAESMTWASRAEDWEALMERLFVERNDDPIRLAHHFYRRSDVAGVRSVLAEVSPDASDAVLTAAEKLLDRVDNEYAFTQSREAHKAHYLKGGEATDARLSTIPMEQHNFENSDELRYHMIETFLRNNPQIENVLDFGCGHGWGTIYWSNKLGRKWTGYDIDPLAIKWCENFRTSAHCKNPNDLTFKEGDIDYMSLLEPDQQFDMIICSEVLEHCLDPIDVAEKLEKKLKPGGVMYITVPFGPSEYGTPNWLDFRNHIWEWDYTDLTTIFAGKEMLSCVSNFNLNNPVTAEPMGFYTIMYKPNYKPLNRLDYKIRNARRRPRETLSAILIGGPDCEDTLRWCLKPLKWICDEIIIGNGGDSMSADALQIAEEFGCKVVPAPDPRQVGFDEARNAGLDAATMDWVLWIDTDEKLLDPHMLLKYLRYSAWAGVSIPQIHFSADAAFPNDLPVRCFRRHTFTGSSDGGKLKGKRMRFYGACHEHPEFELNTGPGPIVILPDVKIAHIGYLNESQREIKFNRNYPLIQMDTKKYPERLIQKYFLMRDNMLLNMYDLQKTGGKVTAAVRERASATVKLYREHFLGKPLYVNLDPQQYYSEALRQLNQGIDVAYQIFAQRNGIGDQFPPGSRVVRVADANELKTEIGRIVEDKMSPLDREFF